MVDYVMVYAIITTITTVIMGYFNYRKKEIIALAMELVVAYADKTVSEEEYKKIVDKFELVLNK